MSTTVVPAARVRGTATLHAITEHLEWTYGGDACATATWRGYVITDWGGRFAVLDRDRRRMAMEWRSLAQAVGAIRQDIRIRRRADIQTHARLVGRRVHRNRRIRAAREGAHLSQVAELVADMGATRELVAYLADTIPAGADWTWLARLAEILAARETAPDTAGTR